METRRERMSKILIEAANILNDKRRMKKEEYLKKVRSATVNANSVEAVRKKYGVELPFFLQQIISCAKKAIFLDNGTKMLSAREIIDATNDLHVDFVSKQIIPVADCGENDFIVFIAKEEQLAKFNIVDETLFKKRTSLDSLI